MRRQWRSKKNALIYFIVQSVGSLSIFAGGVISDIRSFTMKWIVLGLLIKLSLVPFHFWGPLLLIKMDELISIIFLTWQKIAPAFLLMIASSKYVLFFLLIMNLTVGALYRIGSKSLPLLLFFSGLMHIGWIIAGPLNAGIVYFGLYCLSSVPILLNNGNLVLLMLNLGGLPPFTGFIIKISMLQFTLLRQGILILLISIGPLYAYTRCFLISPLKKEKLKFSTILVCSAGLFI